MNNDDSSARAVILYFEKSNVSLAAAERELEAGAYEIAISQAYYAAFYAVSGRLLQNDRHFVKHSGVRSEFHKLFIKSGVIDVAWGRWYDQLFEDRMKGDYLVVTRYDQEYVAEKIRMLKDFLQIIKNSIVIKS